MDTRNDEIGHIKQTGGLHFGWKIVIEIGSRKLAANHRAGRDGMG